MPTPSPFTAEQLKSLEPLIAKRVAEEVAARPAGSSVQQALATKSFTQADRKAAFARAFGLNLKAKVLGKMSPEHDSLPGLRKAFDASVKSFTVIKAALNPIIFGEGGSLMPESWSDEVIEVLRDATVLLQAGARTQETNGKMNVGRLNAAAVAQFVLPGKKPTVSSPDTAAIILDPKKIMALLETTAEMLRAPSLANAETLTQDMLAAIGTESDKQGLIGDGTGANPTGVIRQVKAGNKNNQTAAFKQANLASVITDLDKAERLVRESKISFQGNRPGWIFTSKTLMALKSLRDSAGWVFRQQLDQGTLNGYPFFVTDSISGKGSGGGDPIFFGLWAQLYWAMMGGIEVELDASEQFSSDIIVVRGIGNVDVQLRHDAAIAVIDGVTYT